MVYNIPKRRGVGWAQVLSCGLLVHWGGGGGVRSGVSTLIAFSALLEHTENHLAQMGNPSDPVHPMTAAL